MKISIIGCGYVGLVTAACLAELGHQVMGIDNDTEKIRALRSRRMPIYEPGLEVLVNTHCQEGSLQFSSQISEGVDHGEIIFICVNTPPKEDGSVDLSYVEAVSKEIAENLTEYRLIVEKSTVPVKTGEWVARTIRANVKPGIEFDVASNPEFLREGTAIDDFLRPDRVVIGTDSQRASTLLVSLYEPLNAPLLLTDICSAELIKHSANAFLALKIAFINTVANVCSNSGADIKKVAKGIGLDRRIGPTSLEAGIGYGGMCLPKDVAAFIQIAADLGVDFDLLKAAQRVNRSQRQWPMRVLQQHYQDLKGKRVAVLGLSFKPNTDDLRFAPALDIVAELQTQGATVQAYDPEAMDKASRILSGVKMCKDAYEACTEADCLILCTEWNQFRGLDLLKLKRLMNGNLVIDGRNIFEPQRMARHGFNYYGVGRSIQR